VSPKELKVVHYVNQFFGQEGGEEKADTPFLLKEGPVGPGRALQQLLGDRGRVVATLVCGDNYFAENLERACEQGIALVESIRPDLFLAGPAFAAGRYGIACGAICKAVQERFGIPVVTGMNAENPGVELYRREVLVCHAAGTALKMHADLATMVNLGLRLVSGQPDNPLLSGRNLPRPAEGKYFPRSELLNERTAPSAAERGAEMLLAKLRGAPFDSEAKASAIEAHPAPPPVDKALDACEIALVTDGGLVPKGNPDGMRTRANTVWQAYDLETLVPEEDTAKGCEVAHTGYYSAHVLENPNRLVPMDALRAMTAEGVIKRVHPFLCSTSGNVTTSLQCRKMGREMAQRLQKEGVDGVILTST
jgi:glycine reductase complex component B subunit gamma